MIRNWSVGFSFHPDQDGDKSGRSNVFFSKVRLVPEKSNAVNRMVEGILEKLWRSSRLYMGKGDAPTPYKRERLATII